MLNDIVHLMQELQQAKMASMEDRLQPRRELNEEGFQKVSQSPRVTISLACAILSFVLYRCRNVLLWPIFGCPAYI